MAYLILLLALATFGGLAVWLADKRQKRPVEFKESIQDHERTMAALSPRDSDGAADEVADQNGVTGAEPSAGGSAQ